MSESYNKEIQYQNNCNLFDQNMLEENWSNFCCQRRSMGSGRQTNKRPNDDTHRHTDGRTDNLAALTTLFLGSLVFVPSIYHRACERRDKPDDLKPESARTQGQARMGYIPNRMDLLHSSFCAPFVICISVLRLCFLNNTRRAKRKG